ncbi:hypothetical protein UlMin_043969, partial [Ulmus minor]
GFAVPKEEQVKVVKFPFHGQTAELKHGSVALLLLLVVQTHRGLVAQKACDLVKPWIKTSLAPGSGVVTKYLLKSGMQKYQGFNIVGCGCTTSIGNSGDLDRSVASAISEN